jgi:hypothetical protein
VARHIGRKHGSIGEPTSINTGQTRSHMLVSGSLRQTENPFSKTPKIHMRRFSDITTKLDQESHQGDADRRTSDLFGKVLATRQLEMVTDISQKMEKVVNQNATILATLPQILNAIHKLKQ